MAEMKEEDFQNEAGVLKARHALLMQFVGSCLAAGDTPELAIEEADKAVLLCAKWYEDRIGPLNERYREWLAAQQQIEPAPEPAQIPENAGPSNG
jgi:hypothetical protein